VARRSKAAGIGTGTFAASFPPTPSARQVDVLAAFGGRAAMANVTALAIWSDPADDEAEIACTPVRRSCLAALAPRRWLSQLPRARPDGGARGGGIPAGLVGSTSAAQAAPRSREPFPLQREHPARGRLICPLVVPGGRVQWVCLAFGLNPALLDEQSGGDAPALVASAISSGDLLRYPSLGLGRE